MKYIKMYYSLNRNSFSFFKKPTKIARKPSTINRQNVGLQKSGGDMSLHINVKEVCFATFLL
jgi:hypothetical protein